MITYEKLFSKNALGMKRSVIRELLKLLSKPGVISFAGGLPSPDLFPIKEIQEAADSVLEKEGKSALQYGPTEGDVRLKRELIKLLKTEGFQISEENIIIISASQQGLDLISKIFLNRHDLVIVEEPTYLGAIQAFNSYGAHMIPVKSDNEGMDPDLLEETVKDLIRGGRGDKVKLLYIIPDFQNPSGKTMSVRRRKKIIEIAHTYDLIILEDSPYRQLRYSGSSVAPMYTLDKYQRVVSLFTFSKILTPGFRIGWIVAPPGIIDKVSIAKQAVDLSTSPFTQAILYEYLKKGYLVKQIERIKENYKKKLDYMLKMLDREMPKIKGLSWTKPEGGLFLWVTLPTYMNSRELFLKAINKNVAFVIGEAFHPKAKCQSEFRLNFSFSSMEQIEEGIKRLARAIEVYEEEIKEEKVGGPTVFP